MKTIRHFTPSWTSTLPVLTRFKGLAGGAQPAANDFTPQREGAMSKSDVERRACHGDIIVTINV